MVFSIPEGELDPLAADHARRTVARYVDDLDEEWSALSALGLA